ncbi:MAG: hypothetical protein N2171_02205 [Clostridia bacterium]|nr:hypothetical protein [Clostridia bacterium]
MNQKHTIELLKEIYKSAKTAVDAINILISKSRASNFHDDLERQQREYYNIADEAAAQLHKFRVLPDEANMFTKLGMWSAVQMNTLTNQNSNHMAEIMINGSTMGVIDMTRSLKLYPDVDAHAADLANKLIKTEQNNIEIMKNYL